MSFGLDWATLNGLVMSSEMTTSLRKLVPLYTNGWVTNSIDNKRKLYHEGLKWTGYNDMTKAVATDDAARHLKDVDGFPLPMFVIKTVMGKLGTVINRPPVENSFFDLDEDEDSVPVRVLAAPVRNWAFAPWMCDTIDLVCMKFQVFTNTPTGKEERQVEVGVWLYAWCEDMACYDANECKAELSPCIRLATNAVSSKFYAEGFLRRNFFVYITNTAPAGRQGGEPMLELTRPDPAVGYWQND